MLIITGLGAKIRVKPDFTNEIFKEIIPKLRMRRYSEVYLYNYIYTIVNYIYMYTHIYYIFLLLYIL